MKFRFPPFRIGGRMRKIPIDLADPAQRNPLFISTSSRYLKIILHGFDEMGRVVTVFGRIVELETNALGSTQSRFYIPVKQVDSQFFDHILHFKVSQPFAWDDVIPMSCANDIAGDGTG